MRNYLDATIKEILDLRISELEAYFSAHFLFFYGQIDDGIFRVFTDLVENRAKKEDYSKKLFIVLNTPGGSVETVEKLVNVTRYLYDEVNFIVPDAAYSAGTVFCLSGDNIFMNYSTCLGPIDPQVFNGKNWVPALGYLDKVEELINKSNSGTISPVESMLLVDQDLALLRRYEQARDLTVALIKDWLVKYKFKNWVETEHTKTPVTFEYKAQRAEEIAKKLSDNKLWHSHSSPIGLISLRNNLGLKIDDFSKDKEFYPLLMEYYELSCSYILSNKVNWCFHTIIDHQLYE